MLAGFTPQWLHLSAGGEINVCSFHTERKGTKFTVHHPVSVMVLLLPGTTNGFLLAGVVLVLNAAREDELLCKELSCYMGLHAPVCTEGRQAVSKHSIRGQEHIFQCSGFPQTSNANV